MTILMFPTLSCTSDYANDRIPFLGDCKNKSADYCSSKIQNSVCNWAKGECFCRLGYVAIQEDEEIVCRTLLTDLSCRMDSDCIHVESSICHPGAGKCVCPGGTIYVPHLHACPDVGEKCDEVSRICRAQMAVCVRTVRRSISRDSAAGLCLCPEDTIPVYQTYLHYHECFRKIPKRQQESRDFVSSHTERLEDSWRSTGENKECQSCYNQGGECYDANNDGVGDGCRCPPHRSHETELTQPDQPSFGSVATSKEKTPCSKAHIYSSCSPGSVVVCYLPHSTAKFLHLSLYLQSGLYNAFIGRKDDISNVDKACQLRLQHLGGMKYIKEGNWSTPASDLYCSELKLPNPAHLPCGIKQHVIRPCHTQSSRRIFGYQGWITVRPVGENPGLLSRLHMRFTCETSEECTYQSLTEAPFTRQQKSTDDQEDQRQFTLSILNERNSTVHSVPSSSRIRLAIRPINSRHDNQSFRVDFCVAMNGSLNSSQTEENELIDIARTFIRKNRCGISQKSDDTNKLVSTYHLTELDPRFWPVAVGETERRSEIYRISHLNPREKLIYFLCQIRLYIDGPSDRVPSLIPGVLQRFCSKPSTDDVQIVTSRLIISEEERSPGVCRQVSCFTAGQLATGVFCFLLVEIIFFILIIWCYRGGIIFMLFGRAAGHNSHGEVAQRTSRQATSECKVHLSPSPNSSCILTLSNKHTDGGSDNWVHNHLQSTCPQFLDCPMTYSKRDEVRSDLDGLSTAALQLPQSPEVNCITLPSGGRCAESIIDNCYFHSPSLYVLR
ncbi:unnamed protein product [Calicophoron daubneyi]|uniref:Uncharacterized protein n=1 Tax=Calicophoron daubneyi TaxID=300641 RepID=A0AAV2TUL8_CALDB